MEVYVYSRSAVKIKIIQYRYISKSTVTRDDGSVLILLPENVHKRFIISPDPRGSLIIKVRLATYHKLITVSGGLVVDLSFV